MLGLTIDHVTKRFGTFTAVDDISLAIEQGKFVCFLGPSGCGKTSLLRMIAGLEQPSEGRILFHDKDVTKLPAHERQFGMVFQSLALFPHLSVGDNIAYSLRLRGQDGKTRDARVAELLDLIRLPGIAKRAVSQLSGGQRQRVAIARALAQEPRLFLLDEPLSALDAKLREEMQVELRLLQQQLKITTILVTHDQREAMTLSDLIVVMAKGKVQQVGSPIEIYRNPANRFVADFIGLSNLIEAKVLDAKTVGFDDHAVPVASMPAGLETGSTVTLSVRPEDVRIERTDKANGALSGAITFIRDVGATIEAHIDCGGREFVSVMAPRDWPGASVHDLVTLELPPTACVVLPE
jgi:putative spermidine/putrescine transport system ATP-binding protein